MNHKLNESGIAVVDTGYLRKTFAASHMIVEDNSIAIIDVGTSYSVERLLQAVHDLGRSEEDVVYVIVTHVHLDHAGGAGQLLARLPNARLVVHPKGARHMANPEKLIAGAKVVYGEENFTALYGEILGVDSARIIEAADGCILDLAGRELHFIDSPGHARHHFCVWDPKSRGVFSGDTMGLGYPELQLENREPFLVCTTSPSAFEPDAMLASIERLESLAPATLYLTHYGPVAADKKSISRLKEMVRAHKDLGIQYWQEYSRLEEEIGRVIRAAYTKYLDGHTPDEGLFSLLAEDIVMNAKGVYVWAERSLQ